MLRIYISHRDTGTFMFLFNYTKGNSMDSVSTTLWSSSHINTDHSHYGEMVKGRTPTCATSRRWGVLLTDLWSNVTSEITERAWWNWYLFNIVKIWMMMAKWAARIWLLWRFTLAGRLLTCCAKTVCTHTVTAPGPPYPVGLLSACFSTTDL